ncbi:MAG TPA: DUF3349 domain-containing protein [Frankiaceae bacterium]|jgi:hypothetical protein|nr:DUF3349 domain-containing protein [Frankiaceae bacterium]
MSLLSSVLDYLRAGYPEGVPRQDYVPLLALLRRQLTDEEVREVVVSVLGEANPDSETVDRAIREVTNEPPLKSDLARVSSRLASVGWPLGALETEPVSERR